ncbi:hypothetical protein LIER_09465 [Lithospermum erythrorhizon]|uniref:Uncharacterized protein n=1 Tax=Lithospermum erythrorhizon TaxID=34254 RepID=A0AAV3PGY1_LITER
MSKNDYLKVNGNDDEKCKVCVKAKMPKKPFKKVERKTELLELVHLDICELNELYTRNGKSMRHAYVREEIGNGVVNMIYVKTGDNLTDPLTKSLSRKMVKGMATRMA